jgi:hypothetical protein
MFRNTYTARCVDGVKGYRYLAIGEAPDHGEKRPEPFDLKHKRLNTVMGTHFLDMQFTQGDLIDLIAKKTSAAGRLRLQPVARTPQRKEDSDTR